MINVHFLSLFNRILLRFAIATFLSTIGLLCGLAPDTSSQFPSLVFNSSAVAQPVNDDELRRFAQAAYTIEKKRLAVVQGIVSSNRAVPDTTCAAANTSIPDELKEFCSFSKQIIEANQLTVTRFEQIRNAMQSDGALKQRIDAELRRLESKSL